MNGKTFKIIVIILSCVLLAVASALVLFAAVNGYSARYMVTKLLPGTVENIYKPYEIIDENIPFEASVTGCDGFVYILEDRTLTVYDDKGEIHSSEILNHEEPHLTGDSGRVLVYDRPSGAYDVYEKGDMVLNGSSDRTILGARMQHNGYIVMVLKGRDGFLGSVAVINKKGTEVARYNYADRFPMSGCVIDKNSRFAVASVLENDTGRTAVDVFREYSEVPESGINNGYLMPLLLTVGDSTFAAAGTDRVMTFAENGDELSSVGFNEIIRIDSTNLGCWAADRRTGSDTITHINSKGNVVWKYPTGIMTDGMTVGEQHVFYWSGIDTACLDRDGAPVNIQSSYEPVVGIVDLGNGKIAVVTTGKIIFYEYH